MTTTITAIDLFAGAGGLSLGFHEAGIDSLLAVEKDEMAFATLSSNLLGAEAPFPGYLRWPEWLSKEAHDIEELMTLDRTREHIKAMRGQVDLVAGGPPCQGFSVGGRRNGADVRNDLVFKMLDFIELAEPRMVMIENVEGITRRFIARPGADSATSVADQAIARLGALGYDTSLEILRGEDFGVPQTRRRAVIVATKDGVRAQTFFENLHALREQFLLSKGLPTGRAVNAAEAIGDLHNPQTIAPSREWPKFNTCTFADPTSAYQRLMRGEQNVSGTTPDSHRFANHTEKIRNLFALAHRTQPTGRLSRSFLEENQCKSDKKVLIDPNHPISTVTSHPDEFIHHIDPRIITVREMARFQSFPDSFHFKGRYTINGDRRGHDVARCVQVGNAIPPLLAEALGLAAIKTLTK